MIGEGTSPSLDPLKRCFDLLVGGAALVLVSPLLVMVGLLVWVTIGRPVLFRQKRPGLHGRPFVLYKFRTMRNAVDDRGRPLPDQDRMTRVGRFLRSTSLDELPELWNVVRGDMSLVGPRPLLLEYLDLYTPHQSRRHLTRPGITGWAQINGRNRLGWKERLDKDVWYVENQTLRLDLWIMFMTLWIVIRRKGIAEEGHATMSRFDGTDT